MATRWGICGAGKISYDFCLCLKALPKSEHEIVAVAARDKKRAEEFASRFDIFNSYGSYEELAKDSNIDVIYIGTIHTNHVESSLLFINAGKNVLCEKPMSLSLEGCQRVLKAAKEKGVLFVDAFWSRHFPAYKFILEHIKSGAIGEVVMMQATFASFRDDAIYFDMNRGGGALMDIGCYPVQAANLLFKGKPESIVAQGSKAESGADKTAVILLKYPGGKFASLSYSAETSNGASHLTIYGSQGTIVVPDWFWCPTRVVLKENQVKYFQLPDIQDMDGMTYSNSQGLTYEAKAVRDCLLKGLKECPEITHEDSETIMYILTEVQKQLGIKYNYP
ncbi:trans-1,2-dihydrobenzene-1,2-diol dehydrogenase-like [Physella acuta]|uniref:trans-1,2-dihydrobenzene-1,2-diol dehydrogenase-like n=1 Tax=Physella acuta TaxID=109671 RepID=UPI0027DC19BB|nr:trans-1,2-dihydrobenzene-1,2-diol dehydrogenase-like [Physella acuta]